MPVGENVLRSSQRHYGGRRVTFFHFSFVFFFFKKRKQDPSPAFVSMRDFCDLSFLMDQGLLRADKCRHDHAAISAALRDKRNVCKPQIERLLRLIKYLEAVTPEEKQAVRLEIKKILYKVLP